MNRLLAALCALAALSPATASAHTWNFCLRWVIQQADGNAGEDYYQTDTLMRARGVKVAVMHPNWALPWVGYANESDGCYSFTASETTNFTVTMWAESRIGASSNITLKTFASVSDANAGNVPYWAITTSPGTSGGTVYLQNTASDFSNLIAWSTFVVYWLDQATWPRLGGTKVAQIIHEPCLVVGGSCQSHDRVFIEDGTGDASDKKFLIGHEVGHWLQEQWGAGPVDNTYGYTPGASSPAACKYTGVGGHALRSQEWASPAFSEGFAHFLSTLAFNDHTQTDGYFRYYKDLSSLSVYDDLEADDWIVDTDDLGAAAGGWITNNCDVAAGTSVELDWLRHYWDFRTNSGAAPTHYQLFSHITYAVQEHEWVKEAAYYALTLGLEEVPLGLTPTQHTALVDRWESYAAFNGVAQ